jgi:phosphonate transport system substrate-binding protein
MMAREIRFGLSRHHGGACLDERAAGFSEALGRAIGRPVRLFVEPDYQRLLERVQAGELDVAWLAPLCEARALERGAHLAAVCERGGAARYRSAILVREEAPWARLEDLDGARAAWSDPESASGHLWPRLHLRASGLDLGRVLASERFAGSARAACAMVASGEADLCACYLSGRAGADPLEAVAAIRCALGPAATGLRVLSITEPIPADGMVLRAALDEWTQSLLRDALLGLHRSDADAHALFELTQAARLVPASRDVARVVSALGRLPGLRARA